MSEGNATRREALRNIAGFAAIAAAGGAVVGGAGNAIIGAASDRSPSNEAASEKTPSIFGRAAKGAGVGAIAGLLFAGAAIAEHFEGQDLLGPGGYD